MATASGSAGLDDVDVDARPGSCGSRLDHGSDRANHFALPPNDLADVLFGDVDPSGKLTVSFPRQAAPVDTVTVIAAVPAFVSLVAVIVALPAATALIRPNAETVVIPVLLELQLITRPASTLLFASRVMADKPTVSPTC